MTIRWFGALIIAGGSILLNAQNPVDLFSTTELKQLSAKLAAESKAKGGGFASKSLTHYANHLTMLAYRDATGSSELHAKDADVFMIVEGEATIITGGKMVQPKNTQPNEVRGSGIEGGQKSHLVAGDVMNIQPNTPHQMIIPHGRSITYFVVKVTE